MTKANRVPEDFIIKDGIHGAGVFTKVAFKKGDVLFEMKGPIINHPTRTSVQMGNKKHIEDYTAGHVNHSCTPNIQVNREKQCFECIIDIAAGEEIMFNYNANEDALANPFYCECCGQVILGKKRQAALKTKHSKNKTVHLNENTLK